MSKSSHEEGEIIEISDSSSSDSHVGNDVKDAYDDENKENINGSADATRKSEDKPEVKVIRID